MRPRAIVVGAVVALWACGNAPSMAPDTNEPPALASLAQLVAFEGHETHVNELTLPDGASLAGATIAPEPGAPIEVLQQECVAARCGLLLRILDVVPNRGVGVPSPIDATNHFLEVTLPSGAQYRAVLSVQPLDTLSNGGGNRARVSQPVVLAAGLQMEAGSEFVAATATPIRWVVFGDAAVHGSFALTPAEAPVAGGAVGGGPGDAGGGGPRGGSPGAAGAGGGGGAGTSAGLAGEGSDGRPGGGGAGGEPAREPLGACLSDFGRADCGGGGGGGSDTGSGGHGGGALLLVALGDLRMDGGVVDVSGSAGEAGGGGGGAGQLLLAGSGAVTAPEVRSGGGAPGEAGGAGGDSEPRVDGLRGASGVRLDLTAFDPIVDSSTVRLAGQASEGTVEVRVAGIPRASAPAADGSFEMEVPLQPGLNRLQLLWLTDAGETRVWVGNGIEFSAVAGAGQPLPTGATLDVVYLGS